MKILILSPLYPLPILSGGHARIYNLVKESGKSHEVHLLALHIPHEIPSAPLIPEAHSISIIPWRCNYSIRDKIIDALNFGQWHRIIRRQIDRMSGLPDEAVSFYVTGFEQKLTELLTKNKYDIIQLEYTGMGRYLPLIRKLQSGAKIVLEEIDITYIAMERRIGNSSSFKKRNELRKLTCYERKLWRDCDAIITMSEVDQQHITSAVSSATVQTVANGVDTCFFDFVPLSDCGKRLLFMGYFGHPPNTSGLRHFLSNIYPLIRHQEPETELDIIGADAPPDIAGYNGLDGIKIHGFVPDIRPYLSKVRCLVAPIYAGSGTRFKILEALAVGLPVVSTSIGCEGIKVTDGDDIIIRDSDKEFAGAVCELINDSDTGNKLAHNGRNLVQKLYSWNVISQHLENVWNYVQKK